MKKKIILVGTLYSLLISLLLFELDDIFLVLSNRVKIKYSKKSINNNFIESKVYLGEKKILKYFDYYYNYLKMFIFFKTLDKNVDLYINDYLIESSFLKKKPFY